jgi:hypothetical protein
MSQFKARGAPPEGLTRLSSVVFLLNLSTCLGFPRELSGGVYDSVTLGDEEDRMPAFA